MKLCFYQRLSLTLVSIFLVMVSIFFWWSNNVQNLTRSHAEQQLHLELADHLVSMSPALQQGEYDKASLKQLFETLMVLGPNFEFYYVSPEGEILTHSAKPGEVKQDNIDVTPIKMLVESSDQLPIYGSDPRRPEQSTIFSATPIYVQNQLQGYVYVAIGGKVYDTIVSALKDNHNLAEVATIMLGTLVLLLGILLALFKYFTKPMKQLTEAMDNVRSSGFDAASYDRHAFSWNCDSRDEIQRLGCAFAEMMEHIQSQFDQLQQTDNQRRVLLADLSHDLRTPLASLQGYIETLALNGSSLSEEDRNRFVNTSLKNARNLKHLIDQIFELAYLEAGQVTLNLESFPVEEFLYDVADNFALKAKDKGIQLAVNIEKGEHQVFADIGKLERVLTNLIENAIRHTPTGGVVTLGVESADDRVKVSVNDTGIGINKNEIAYIFDARYQASNSQKDSNLHAGLGLAISKKLMSLLDSNLAVDSQEGQGTCFSFDLQLAESH